MDENWFPTFQGQSKACPGDHILAEGGLHHTVRETLRSFQGGPENALRVGDTFA